MKRLFCGLALVCLCLCLLPAVAFADGEIEQQLDETIEKSLEGLDFDELDGYSENFGGVEDKIRSILNGDFDNAEDFWQYAVKLLFEEVQGIIPALTSVLAICVICGLVQRSGGLISADSDKIISFVGFAAICLTVFALVKNAYTHVSAFLNTVSNLTDLCMPILLTLVVANGGNVTASVYQPSVAMLSGTVIGVISKFVLPLSAFALVFSVISNLSDNIRVNKMSDFLNSGATWALSILFMLFSAFVTVQGITAAAIDGVSVRAAKFATKNYIPLLGGYLADGFDLIMASASLIKNAFGLVALLMLLWYIIVPIVNVVAVNIGLQFVAAVVEPVADKKFVAFLSSVGKRLTFWVVLILAVAFMFFVLVMLAIYSANYGG